MKGNFLWASRVGMICIYKDN